MISLVIFSVLILLIISLGRDNDNVALHIPRTYNVTRINGSLEFTTYDQKPVNVCNDREGK